MLALINQKNTTCSQAGVTLETIWDPSNVSLKNKMNEDLKLDWIILHMFLKRINWSNLRSELSLWSCFIWESKVSVLEGDEVPHGWCTYSLENTRNQPCTFFRREVDCVFLCVCVQLKCFLSPGTSIFGPNLSLV